MESTTKVIERDTKIKFHEEGTLKSVTRWMNRHEDGFAEWMKNVRAAYNRENLKNEEKVAVLLFQDATEESPAKLGILDVGGATNEDVERWGVWQDPEASGRGSNKNEEITQGNGGKAYMYKLFSGPSYILGIKKSLLNCKGFIGKNGTLERGIPGYIPDINKARNADIKEWDDFLISELDSFGTSLGGLPKEVRETIVKRKCFTLVQGSDPLNWEKEPDVKSFIKRVVKQAQATLAIEQVKFYAIHNGEVLFGWKPIELEKITPYSGFEEPLEFEIPELLPHPEKNKEISTTKKGTCEKGKIILQTSQESMESNFVRLRPRWKVTYRTKGEIAGQKDIPEISPTTPGSHFIYATVFLEALNPDYINVGRTRPNDGDLISAVDAFLAEKIRELAKRINETRKMQQDEDTLDEIYEDNKFLNDLKNEFMPPEGDFDLSSVSDTGGSGGGGRKGSKIIWGKIVDKIDLSTYQIKIGKKFKINIVAIIKAVARDKNNLPVPAQIFWKSDNEKVVSITKSGDLEAKNNGKCKLYAYVNGVTSPPAEVFVHTVQEIILSPRTLQIPLGSSKQITTKIKDNSGAYSTDIFVNWKHDADNQEIVKINPRGYVFGNILGKTKIYAGIEEDNLWNEIPTEVEIIKGNTGNKGGKGFPQLLMTDRDKDPFTGEIRKGSSEEPALWQDVQDVQNNIWWLNMQSKDANYAYSLRSTNKPAYRIFHAKILVEMMIQAWMNSEYTKKGDEEKPELWSSHKGNYERFYIDLTSRIWDRLSSWIKSEENGENER